VPTSSTFYFGSFGGIREEMKKWHVAVLVFLALATMLSIPRKFCFGEPSVCGARDAREDLAHGRFVLPDYGFPFGVRPETDQCLRQHELEVRIVGLDIMSNSQRSYYQSYISVMNTAIGQKFSPGVFEQCCRYQPTSLKTACRPVNE
jgi:hypothetical protein